MFCNNCGNEGHMFRDCKEDITSYGIILTKSDHDGLSFLMVRRKDSMSYSEFIAGKYSLDNPEYVKKQIKNMTITEQTNILNNDFETLWKKLWRKKTDSDDYINSKQKFELLNFDKLILENPSSFTDPEWGFPKGRKTRNETNLHCAIREFTEETNIPLKAYDIREDKVFTESFTGTNGVRYKHVYFLAILKNPELIDLTQDLTSIQKREISLVEWKNIEDSKASIRPHYSKRVEIIDEIVSLLSS